MSNFRQALYKLLPTWLTTGESQLVAHSLMLVTDLNLEKVRHGLLARFPGSAGPSALALIGVDRGIPRGRAEEREHFAGRLRRWRYPRGHRTRGSAFALLEQVVEYWGTELAVAGTFDVNQTVHTRTAAGVEAFAYGVAWDWDGDTDSRARFWLYMQTAVGSTVASWGDWGDAPTSIGLTWASGRGKTWGQRGATLADVTVMRSLFRGPGPRWKPAGTHTDYAMLSFGAVVLAPFGGWGTLQERNATRPAGVRFWKLGR